MSKPSRNTSGEGSLVTFIRPGLAVTRRWLRRRTIGLGVDFGVSTPSSTMRPLLPSRKPPFSGRTTCVRDRNGSGSRSIHISSGSIMWGSASITLKPFFAIVSSCWPRVRSP